ncbi:MAG: ABC transporter permease [Bacteroides sp.]|nr:ABC transporter permease [Bacteroides sp.]
MKQIYYAIQNIIRGKDSTIIKVVSLSLGLFLSIILFALVATELNYDSFYRENEDIYVVETTWEGIKPSYYCIYPTAQALMEHFPEQVESATVINDFTPRYVQHGKEDIRVDLIGVDSLFFQTMGIPLIEGNALDMNIPDAIFLSQSTAKRIFGSENAMGKSILWQNKHKLIVKGIFVDVPENVTIKTGAVMSLHHPWVKGVMRTDWSSGGNWPTFVRLKKGADVNYINQRINTIVGNYVSTVDSYEKRGLKNVKVSLTPLRGYNFQNEKTRNMVAIVSLLGFVLLLTASFNYALISISSLSHRAKAIGVHKCNGAETGNIFGMFLWETLYVTGVSLLIAIFLILNFQEQIEELTSVRMETMFALNNLWAPMLTIATLFFIGAILPGKLFSSIPVTQVFHRYTEGKKRWKYPLLFIQFGGTAFIMGFLSVTYTQYHYVMNKDMGYNSDRVVYVRYLFENTANALSNIRNLPYVEGAEFAMNNLLNLVGTRTIMNEEGKIKIASRYGQFNENFLQFMDIRLKAGKYHTTHNEILVNPTFVKEMGWTSNGIGEVVDRLGTVTGIIDIAFPDQSESSPYYVSWISEGIKGFPIDMHARLKEPFEDNLIRLNEDMAKIYPNKPPVFRSYERTLQNIFRTQRTFRDSVLVACIAILAITLMGVIGYTNDEVRRRSKEIAIRKVNGAEVSHILRMLCRDIAIIALPAVLIGTLASKYVGEVWVSTNFKDILAISPLLYVAVFLVTMAFILGTVIVKSWRVANENPVLSIKSE